ncbi:hypothetical protein ABZP36_015767 [Zizania latifolia]
MFCGARRRMRDKRQSTAAWVIPLVFFLFFVFFVLLLPDTLPAMSGGEAAVVGYSAGNRLEVRRGNAAEQPPAGGGEGAGERRRVLRRLGSRPPCCERRCGGCAPCTAVQVRAGAAAGPSCAASNYEPVGWKCKCGSVLFDP